MKLRVMTAAVVFALSFFGAGILSAANGDLIVNGNLGVGTSTPAGKAEINGNLVVDGDTAMKGNVVLNSDLTVEGKVTAPNVLAKFYESPEQDITDAGGLTLAHGLGAAPKLIQVWLVCKTAQAGYSVGDVVFAIIENDSGAGSRGVGIVVDVTNITVRYGTAGNIFVVPNKNTGAHTLLTNAYWKAIFRVWAF